MLSHPIAQLRHKLDLTLKMSVCGAIALAAVLVALGFFCAAAFMRIAQDYGPVMAAAALGGAFVAVAIVAVLVAVVLRRNTPPPPPPPQQAWWNDPVMLATALDISRMFGRKRMASAVVIGAFVVGMLLNRSSRPRTPPAQG